MSEPSNKGMKQTKPLKSSGDSIGSSERPNKGMKLRRLEVGSTA
jgi:hypothetical protein